MTNLDILIDNSAIVVPGKVDNEKFLICTGVVSQKASSTMREGLKGLQRSWGGAVHAGSQPMTETGWEQ